MSDAQDTEGVQLLQITNGTDGKIKARFHGEDYFWPVGGVVTPVPLDAAEHIFGFGLEDKTKALHRLGWLTASSQLDSAMERLTQIKFEPVHQVLVMGSERPRRGRPRKAISNDRSLVKAGGDSGEESFPDDPDDLEGEATA